MAKVLPGVLILFWILIVCKRVTNFQRNCLRLLQLLTVELLTFEGRIPNFIVRPWGELLLQLLLMGVPPGVPQGGN